MRARSKVVVCSMGSGELRGAAGERPAVEWLRALPQPVRVVYGAGAVGELIERLIVVLPARRADERFDTVVVPRRFRAASFLSRGECGAKVTEQARSSRAVGHRSV